jgi:GAF domain-containing protein
MVRLNDHEVEQGVTRAVDRARELIGRGEPAERALAVLVEAAEAVGGVGCVSSILVLDRGGLLRNGASPKLPADYLAAIDRLRPDPNVGTCAAAAATGRMVLCPDFRADSKWAELKHLPMSLGFVGAWSMPIKGDDGGVLGTFGTYFREHREPSSTEVAAVARLSKAAAGAIGTGRLTCLAD